MNNTSIDGPAPAAAGHTWRRRHLAAATPSDAGRKSVWGDARAQMPEYMSRGTLPAPHSVPSWRKQPTLSPILSGAGGKTSRKTSASPAAVCRGVKIGCVQAARSCNVNSAQTLRRRRVPLPPWAFRCAVITLPYNSNVEGKIHDNQSGVRYETTRPSKQNRTRDITAPARCSHAASHNVAGRGRRCVRALYAEQRKPISRRPI
ncbi:hypothetical protein EVAR_49831_1 [Eumeta japonica]|uniref:Uncharacterized protein n=1 Tax=Eumeta variegata TaxID=151549 RepID=A0A4C1YWK1_EUMVA|nr:hypothetical protein EVAR_49831_1 [Eumeta japonica]